jgi:hypothetical protein
MTSYATGTFQYEWYTVRVREATGVITWEVKAKNRENAIKAILKQAREHDEFVRPHRPDFETVIYWNTFKLDRTGHQR